MKDALLTLRRDGGVTTTPLTGAQLEQFRQIERYGEHAKVDGRIVRSLVRLGLVEAIVTTERQVTRSARNRRYNSFTYKVKKP